MGQLGQERVILAIRVSFLSLNEMRRARYSTDRLAAPDVFEGVGVVRAADSEGVAVAGATGDGGLRVVGDGANPAVVLEELGAAAAIACVVDDGGIAVGRDRAGERAGWGRGVVTSRARNVLEGVGVLCASNACGVVASGATCDGHFGLAGDGADPPDLYQLTAINTDPTAINARGTTTPFRRSNVLTRSRSLSATAIRSPTPGPTAEIPSRNIVAFERTSQHSLKLIAMSRE